MKKIFSRTVCTLRQIIESRKGGRRRNKSEGKYQKGEQYVDLATFNVTDRQNRRKNLISNDDIDILHIKSSSYVSTSTVLYHKNI